MMNRVETIEWLTNHCHAFPDFGSWVAGIQPTEKRSKLLDAWAEALQDIEPRDAKAVTARMLSGDDPPIAAYEREQTPAKVRLLAKANRDRRSERDRQTSARQRNEVPRSGHVPSGQSAGQLYRLMMDLLDANPSMTAREAADKVMPPPSDDGPRFNCPLCLDSGLVTVWSSVSVRAVLYGGLDDPAKRKTCAAPCKCPEGTRRVWSGNGDPPPAWRGWRSLDACYSPTTHCICSGGDTDSGESVKQFREWVALALDQHQNRNRVSAFDDFNQQPARDHLELSARRGR